MKENKKLVYLEFLRIFATLVVMLVHICNSAKLINDNVSMVNKAVCTIIYNLFCIAVPIFVMITGVLLLNPEKGLTLEKLIKKYMFRMILILLTFGVGYAWLELIFTDKSIGIMQLINAFSNMFQGQTWAHMWYIYMLVGLYAVTPIFRAFIKHGNKNEIKFFAIVMFLFICIPHIIEGFTGYKIGFYTPITYVYPLYYVLGYCIGNSEENKSRDHKIYALAILSFIVLVGSGIIEVYLGLDNFKNVALFSSPFILFLGLGTFIYFKNNGQRLEKYYGKVVKSIARCSFGMYIYHMFFINLIYKLLKFNPLEYPAIIAIPAAFIVVCVCSYSATWISLKIPFIRKYLL